MSNVTLRVSNYIRNKGINLSELSRDTGIPYMALYNSILNDKRNRDLRDEEFLGVCAFLRVDPRIFADKKDGQRLSCGIQESPYKAHKRHKGEEKTKKEMMTCGSHGFQKNISC